MQRRMRSPAESFARIMEQLQIIKGRPLTELELEKCWAILAEKHMLNEPYPDPCQRELFKPQNGSDRISRLL